MVHTASTHPGDASPPSAGYVVAVNPILQDPRFQVLVHRRRTFAWSLTATMLIVYFGFILTLAFSPQTLESGAVASGMRRRPPACNAPGCVKALQ